MKTKSFSSLEDHFILNLYWAQNKKPKGCRIRSNPNDVSGSASIQKPWIWPGWRNLLKEKEIFKNVNNYIISVSKILSQTRMCNGRFQNLILTKIELFHIVLMFWRILGLASGQIHQNAKAYPDHYIHLSGSVTLAPNWPGKLSIMKAVSCLV